MEYFDGKVTINRLGSKDAEGRFYSRDDRGDVAMLIAGKPVEYVETAEFNKAGVRRGFHVHAVYRETLYIAYGEVKMWITSAQTDGEIIAADLQTGDLVQIAPGIEHGFVSASPALLITCGTGANPFDDRVPADRLNAHKTS